MLFYINFSSKYSNNQAFCQLGYLAFYFPKMLFISYKFQERSEGADEILIWIPQMSVALGSLVFFIAIFHQLILTIFKK